MAIVQALNDEGFAVETAMSVGDVFRALERGNIGLVVLDVGLPGVEEPGGPSELKRDPRLRHVPMILISSSTETSEAVQRVRAQPQGLIGWPELLGAVRNQFKG